MPAGTAATARALSNGPPTLRLPPGGMKPPANDARWRDLGVRTASGIVLAGVGLAAIWVGGWVWLAIVVLLGLIMSDEWAGLCRNAGVGSKSATSWRGIIGLRGSGLLALGAFYIAPAVFALIWLRAQPNGYWWLLLLAGVVWGGDVGAYLVGRLVGGPRLAPAISPGKTWSGAIGGTLAAVLAGVLIWPERASLIGPVALLLSLTAQAGDLLESAIKRRFGVKDSGRLIPGHGGLLDRLDGVLTAAPMAAIVLLVIGK